MRDDLFRLHRRAFLGRTAGVLGPLALAHLLDQDRPAVASVPARPSGLPAGKAKAVICLFQHGGPSQMDLFDPKPALTKWHGKPHPGQLEVHFDKQAGNVLGSPFAFAPRGGSGIELSELLPRTSEIADQITLVRSMTTESVDHESALRLIHTGKFQAGRPTLGSWVIYGLGTENRNLPAYVVLSDPGGLPVDGVRNWSSGWLPAVYQGTPFRPGGSPVLNLETPSRIPPAAREGQLRFLGELNRAHLRDHPGQSELEARIANYETAARMQTAVPEALSFAAEGPSTRRLYGLDDPATREYGSRCLLSRRLVERGVRFVQVFMSGQPWDTHSKNAETLKGLCRRTDGPSAALVQDLKQRGLLDSTIVLWTGEFGRLPISQGTDGRDHNRHGFSLWLAGGGFRAGYAHGKTDDFGYKSVEDVVSVHDLQATLLHVLGLDHRRLTYPHDGRPDSLTDVDVTGARVVRELLA
ncbi:hypothetical protein OJF2_29690 [Aquisphaera giovannonii]|uniref:Sulfatase n=1 Tax=Aquisphaera giovannonii TaxID=406548 RepID=A0A5B9W3A8_9BACT|nr:DUF1501 domain-containing protein [Aquisphaera giovannonii]QEH34430.1 hypothetical protein OJF2_29690 [Aquisphaera giovannonii]